MFQRLKIYLERVAAYFSEASKLRAENPACFGVARLAADFPYWFAGLRHGASAIADGRPWLTFGAIDFLDAELVTNMRIFEYGSGGSTLYFSSMVREVVTVEHDAGWCERVRQELSARGRKNVTLLLREPEEDQSLGGDSHLDPRLYASSSPEYPCMSFKNYVAAIDGYPDGHFDFISIDGRARNSCMEHVLRKLAPGGMIMLDNAERPEYSHIHSSLSGPEWKLHDFQGPGPYTMYFWRTCIWKKL